ARALAVSGRLRVKHQEITRRIISFIGFLRVSQVRRYPGIEQPFLAEFTLGLERRAYRRGNPRRLGPGRAYRQGGLLIAVSLRLSRGRQVGCSHFLVALAIGQFLDPAELIENAQGLGHLAVAQCLGCLFVIAALPDDLSDLTDWEPGPLL